MNISQSAEKRYPGEGNYSFQSLPRFLFAPLPLFLLQPVLQRLIRSVSHRRPELFIRLKDHAKKKYLIDPINLPFTFLLSPDPLNPSLRAFRRSSPPLHDAEIAGTILTLLDMIDGRLDGDALFFSRDLVIRGDIEAVVVLRNALDDLDGSIIKDIIPLFGKPVQKALIALRKTRTAHDGK